MIDMQKEQVYDLARAAKFVPGANGKAINTSTVYRWCVKGSCGVRLEHIRLGRRVLTSEEAISRFANKLAQKKLVRANGQRRARNGDQSKCNDSERAKAIADAEKQLESEGI